MGGEEPEIQTHTTRPDRVFNQPDSGSPHFIMQHFVAKVLFAPLWISSDVLSSWTESNPFKQAQRTPAPPWAHTDTPRWPTFFSSRPETQSGACGRGWGSERSDLPSGRACCGDVGGLKKKEKSPSISAALQQPPHHTFLQLYSKENMSGSFTVGTHLWPLAQYISFNWILLINTK